MEKKKDRVICTCDESGVHYPCPTCGKLHDDELDALFCCMEECLEEEE